MNFCSLFDGLAVAARRKGKWGKEMGAGKKFFWGAEKWTSLVHFCRGEFGGFFASQGAR